MVKPHLDRRAVVAALLQNRDGLLIVTGLGSPSYDVHAAGDQDDTFYLWGAMGSAALVGLGLAQAQPDRRVVVLTGDGEQLMGLGGLATIAVADNGHFGETGMQLSHTGHGLDLAKIADAAGFAEALTVTDDAGVARVAEQLSHAGLGPRLYVIRIKAENLPRSLPARDAVYLKNRLRAHLGFGVS